MPLFWPENVLEITVGEAAKKDRHCPIFSQNKYSTNQYNCCKFQL
jgi:hypothetical protein